MADSEDLFKSLEGAVHDYTSGALDGYDKEDVAGLLEDRLEKASERLEAKVFATMRVLRSCPLGVVEFAEWIQLDYFHTALIRQMDLVERRLLRRRGLGVESS